MRRLLLMVTLTAACVMGVSAAASAYPPGGPTLTLSASTVAPGATFGATFDGCQLGETVSVSVEGGDSASATCAGPAGESGRMAQPAGGTASVTLTAPTAPGTYTVTGTTSESGLTATATLTVVAAEPAPGQLPTTGSGSSVPIAQIAAGMLIAGAGLAGVAMYRRRPAART